MWFIQQPNFERDAKNKNCSCKKKIAAGIP